MTNVQHILDSAEAHCRSHGSRLTDKRKNVLSGLLGSGKALSAYELVDYCKEEFGHSIPAMSVYRILDFLQEEQLVHKLNLANKYVACSHITCDHAHEIPQFLICDLCSQVTEISVSRSLIDDLKKNVEDADYQLLSPQIELNCLCQACAA
ncbi:MAG: transcriptional repressor [Porticoccaceae bacterium]|jgi:Fur family transcriptional regulator, zinc uptake regulator|nr:transcriptional repressor [Porticoccaceae bacterium]